MIDFKKRLIKAKNKDDFKFSKEDQYFTLVSRRTALLLRTCFPMGYSDSDQYKRVYGLSVKHTPFYTGHRQVFLDRKSMNELKEAALEKMKERSNFLIEIAEKCQQDGRQALDYGQELKKLDYQDRTDEELKELAQAGLERLFGMSAYLIFPLSIQTYLEESVRAKLEEKFKDEKLVEESFQGLATPIKANFGYFEQKTILELAVLCKDGQEILEGVNKYLLGFDAMGTKYGIGRPWTQEQVIERIKYLATQDPEKKLEHLIKVDEENEEKAKEIVEALGDEEFSKLVECMRTYIFLRTYRTDVLTIVTANMFALLEEIAKRNNLGLDDVLNCFPHEVAEFDFPDKELIRERIKNVLLQGDDGNVFYTYGSMADEVVAGVKKVIDVKDDGEEKINVEEISGSPANKGKVTGTVRVVLDNTELGKVEEGDIIVASMTTPDFVPAMEKATAFVTDEGGILCHAAIVSREMNKPCVIGTKIATKVLKDGDRVEVDAEKGIVKIIR